MSNIIGVFILHGREVTVYSDSTYQYTTYSGSEYGPYRFRFNPNGKLRIFHHRIDGTRHHKRITINPMSCNSLDKEFYLRLKELWDNYIVETLILEVEDQTN